ncbi:MAG: hypothetical protein RLZZ196_165 [Bacteroidota bacterium]|jgi:hypothetical protein
MFGKLFKKKTVGSGVDTTSVAGIVAASEEKAPKKPAAKKPAVATEAVKKPAAKKPAAKPKSN